jgi:prolyl-tRNA synthetase
MSLNPQDQEVRRTADEIYDQLVERGVDVFYDDRDERPGVKFKDADLIGIPIRVAVGAKSLAEGKIELSLRRDREKHFVTPAEAAARVGELLAELGS